MEQKDILEIAAAVQSALQGDLNKLENKMDNLDKKLDSKVDIILDEIDRVHEASNNQFDQLDKKLEELKQFYRIQKLENDKTDFFINIIEDLKKRIEELERKIA